VARNAPNTIAARSPPRGRGMSIPLDKTGCPDLQALVDHAGRRYAAFSGEECVDDPFKRPPHQGGSPHITPQEWAEYDRAMAAWQAARRPLR